MNRFMEKTGSVILQLFVTVIFVFSFLFSVAFAGAIYVMRRLKIIR